MKYQIFNRRQFAQGIASTAIAGSVLHAEPLRDPEKETAPFPLSIMLWTVWTDLPFEQRLANVAQAGYTNVELVGEYAKWTDAEFARANAARKRLGISFDATAGSRTAGHRHGLADPAHREPFLAELKASAHSNGDALLPGNDRPLRQRCPRPLARAAASELHRMLKRAAELIEGKQIDGQPVRLLLECIDPDENPHYFLQSAAEAIEIVRAVNHPQVQFLYDIFHEQIAEGNLIEKLDKHIDVIGLIHVADVPGRHEPGTGEINYSQHLSQTRGAEISPRGRHGVPPHRRSGVDSPRSETNGFGATATA